MFDKIKNWWNNLPSTFLGVDIKSKTTWLIGGFIVLLVFMLATEDADAAETTTSIEVAPTLFVAGNRYNGGLLILEERFNKKYALGVGLTTEWVCPDVNDCRRGNGPTNQVVYAQRVVTHKKFEIGLGISYWHNQSPSWDSNTPYALSLGWNFNKNLNAKWRHFSTGGSSDRNGGLDMFTIGWRF